MKRTLCLLACVVAILATTSVSHGWMATTHYNMAVYLTKDPFIRAYLDMYEISPSLVRYQAMLEPPSAGQWATIRDKSFLGWDMTIKSVGTIIHHAGDCAVPSNHNPAGLLGYQNDLAEIRVEEVGAGGRMPGAYTVYGAAATYEAKVDAFYAAQVNIVNDYKSWHSKPLNIFRRPYEYYDRGVRNGMTLAHAALFEFFQVHHRGYGSGYRGNYFPYVDGEIDLDPDDPDLVPEPATLSILGLGMMGLISRRRNKK